MESPTTVKAAPTWHETIVRGTLLNVLGSCGKALIPVYFILITRLFGPAVMGVYYLAFIAVDMALSLTAAGFNDGVLMYCSRYADDSADEERFYQVLANGFLGTTLIALLLIFLCHFGGPEIIRANYPQQGFLETVQIMSLALPFVVLSIVIIAATKSQMSMKWDAFLMGFLRPLLLILGALLAFMVQDRMPRQQLRMLALGYLVMSMFIAVAALIIYARFFSFVKLLRAFVSFRLQKGLLTFVVPQNLNRTFNTFVTSLDVMMLGYFGFPAETVGFYGIGAQIVRNVREIKLAVAGSYAPVIVRQHMAGDIQSMSVTMSLISRWTISIALPLAVAVGILRQDLLLLFHDSFTMDSSFMLVLLVPPLLSCGFGIAGNVMVMSGYSLLNLLNSVTVAACNCLFNALLIPRFGLLGAAVATLLASACLSCLQLVETRYFLKARVFWGMIYQPYLAALPVIALLLLFSALSLPDTFMVRLTETFLSLAVYLVTLTMLLPGNVSALGRSPLLTRIFRLICSK
jgi:O-antigen/teichoic acid export membrane protein